MIATAGLRRAPACLSVDEIGVVLDHHRATVARWVRQSKTLLLDDASYQNRLGSIARDAIDLAFGRRV